MPAFRFHTLLFLLLLTSQFPALAQDDDATRRVSGRVLDTTDGLPLPNVQVFYSGTTIGRATDNGGGFSLPLPPIERIDLVISMLGYEVEKVNIDILSFDFEPLTIRLRPQVMELDEVLVMGEKAGPWLQNLDRFKEVMFSTTALGKRCRIVNAHFLEFEHEQNGDRLIARSPVPIEILNFGLGYRITIHDLRLNGNVISYNLSGGIAFEELEPEDEEEANNWREARRSIYLGSRRHFLRTLVEDRLDEEGFKAYHVFAAGTRSTNAPIFEMHVKSFDGEEGTPIVSSYGDPDSRSIMFTGAVWVQYSREPEPPAYARFLVNSGLKSPWDNSVSARSQNSWLILPSSIATIDVLGNVIQDFPGVPVAHYGYWGWQRFGEALPYEYDPDE